MPIAWGPTGLSGASLAALGAIGAITLTALYFVRRRRRRVIVPFVALWVPVAAANTFAAQWGHRLRRLGSLILQLAILSMILLAAGDPAPVGGGAGGRAIVVLIDRSASMRATDERGPRLDRARELARQIIDELAPNDWALVAAFAGQTAAISGWDNNHEKLKAAIATVAACEEPGDAGEALSFAGPLLRGRANPTLIVIGDGSGAADGIDDQVGGPLNGVDVRFLPVGRRPDNVGFAAFSAGRSPADPTSVELVAVMQSSKAAPTDILVTITSGLQRIPVARRAVHLEPGARTVTAVSSVITADTRFEATIENGHDDFALDDHAYAVVPPLPPLSVLAVGRRNLYLEGALLGMAASVRVDRVSAGDVDESRPRWEDYDVVIFDDVTPRTAPQTGHHLYLNPNGAGSPWAQHGSVVDPVVTDVKRDHPLVRQLGLADLNVATARRLTLRQGDVAVVAAAGTPLIIARERPNLRDVAIAFDVRRSDLPLRSAFPLLMSNALSWLAQRAPTRGLSFPTGRTVRVDIEGLRVAAATKVAAHATAAATAYPPFVDVVMPDGPRFRTPVVAGGVSLNLDHVGIVGLFHPDGRAIAEIAVNLRAVTESDTPPAAAPLQGKRGIVMPDGSRRTARHEFWLAALVTALGLVALEWVTFHRKMTV